ASTSSQHPPSICHYFSSRRRHTRCYRDWSSDVCSSDLLQLGVDAGVLPAPHRHLELVDVIGAPCERGFDRRLEAGGEAGFGQEEIGRASCREIDELSCEVQYYDVERVDETVCMSRTRA